MTLGRLGVWYSTDKLNGSQLADLVGVVEKSGYSALWYPESRGYELMSLAGYLLSKSAHAHHRQLDREYLCARFLHRAAGHVSLNDLYRRSLHPRPGRQPRAHGGGPARPSLRQARAGHAGLSRRHQQGLPQARRRLSMVAALGPMMLTLSAEKSRGALPYNVTPEHTEQAGRSWGRSNGWRSSRR